MRDLHLYAGLFVGPFILVFALSAILLNHPPGQSEEPGTVTEAAVTVPGGIARLEGMPRVAALQGILAQLGVSGEVGWVNLNPQQNLLTFPVTRPGTDIMVRLDLARQHATIETKRRGLAAALHWLHKLPGPHLANIRGNWVLTRVWRVLADLSVYLILFLTATGLYLWILLRAERKIGLVILLAGAVLFVGIIYALAG